MPPLLAQRRGCDDEDAAFAFSPVLADYDPGLDGFTQANLVSQDHARGEGGAQSEQCRVHLVGFRFDLGVKEQPRQFAHVIARVGAIQLVGVELGLVIAKHTILHHSYSPQLSGAATL